MRKIDILRNLALSFPETHEEPHFENISFKVNKKIFATYDEKLNQLCLKFQKLTKVYFQKSIKTGSIQFPINGVKVVGLLSKWMWLIMKL